MRMGNIAVRVSWGAMVGAFALLGALWAADRGRSWERPRLSPAAFVALRGAPAPVSGPRGLLLVPVNPGCPHCLASWRRLRASCRARGGCPELVVLLVDQQRRPAGSDLEPLGAERIWWDRLGTWRREWGHRIYGERILFDAAGRYRETLPPLMSP